jgi:hypothetical protein
MDTLAHSENLNNAVEAAIRADVIIVSINAASEPARPLCTWIDAWLPHRPHQSGALVVLIGGETGLPISGVEIYLKSVAQRSGLDYLPRRHTPMALPRSAQVADASNDDHTTASILKTILDPPTDAPMGSSTNE